MGRQYKIEDIKNFMPKDKVGIRYLGDLELENVFPSYDSLLQRIEEHRKNVSNIVKDTYQTRDYQLDMMYDNVFSLMGKRGSGKTSTLMTLKVKLDSQNEYDMVLPLVIPDVIPEDESIMSWLIAILEDKVIDLEEQIDKCRSLGTAQGEPFDNCKVKEKLRNSFEKIKKMSLSKNFKPESSSSYYDMVGGAELKMRNSYSFSKELSRFWDELVQTIKGLQENRGNEKGDSKEIEEPLIFVMFDDVDLNPERASELISVIIKYLSHPNVIVLTTADENLFMKVVENNFKNTLYGANIRMGNKTVESALRKYFDDEEDDDKHIDEELAAKTMAKMYLDKVLPPSSRYFLKSFIKWSDKCEFRVEFKREGGSLQDMLAKLIYDFYKHIEGTELTSKEQSFLFYNRSFLKFYVSFFGSTSRQIQNQWIIICEFIKDIKKLISNKKIKRETYVRKMYYKVREFLHNSINTNSEFKKDIEDIDEYVDHIFYWEYNSYPFYIDYNYISEVLWSESRVLSDKSSEFEQKQQRAMALLALCAFVENILLLIDSGSQNPISEKRNKVHLGKSVEKHIEWLVGNNSLIRREKTPDSMLYYYEEFLENMKELAEFNLYSGKSVRGLLMKLDRKAEESNVLFQEIDEDWGDKREYYNMYARMLIMYYSDMYCIDRVLLNKVQYIAKVFEIPCRSSIAIQRINTEMIVQYVLSNILNKDNQSVFEKFLSKDKEFAINMIVADGYYSLGQALNKVMREMNDEDKKEAYQKYINSFADKKLDYNFWVNKLEGVVKSLAGYVVVNSEQILIGLEKIETICEQSNVFYSSRLLSSILEIKLKLRMSENDLTDDMYFISKDDMDNFVRELTYFNTRTNRRFNQVVESLVWNIGTAVDLCVEANEEELMHECARILIMLMMLHESIFREMFQNEKERSMYSVKTYEDELFNYKPVMSKQWYEKFMDRVCVDDALASSVFHTIEDYLLGIINN